MTTEQFWSKINKQDGVTDACWLWTGYTIYGYGYAFWENRTWRAHRLAWKLTHPDKPVPALLRHTCDVRSCVNPAHLLEGTHQENMADKVSRGRVAKGERNGGAKLTRDQVNTIRQLLNEGQTQQVLAKQFGVSQGTISLIARNVLWNDPTWIRVKQQKPSVNKGESHGLAKLTNAQALEILMLKNSGRTQRSIASQFKVHRATVAHIWKGVAWKFLQEQT